MDQILASVKPDVVAVERVFFAKNITNALSVSQARGVIMMAIEAHQLPIFEYTPMQVKQAITGYGRSKKTEIQQMVAHTLELEVVPRPDDAADALAVAICYARNNPKLPQLA